MECRCGKSKAVAVVVDNGEELLEESLNSLLDQTVKPYIIVASGPKTDLELAESLADEVMEPTKGIGKARVQAILASYQDYVFSCDSDTLYEPDYVYQGVNFLKSPLAFTGFVKAGCINPHPNTPNLFAKIESWWASIVWPYEFSLAFKRKAFLDFGLHNKEYEGRIDLSYYIWFPVPSNPLMACYTRLPTRFVEEEIALVEVSR